MIRYALTCDNAHSFEAWFRSSEDFDRQEKRGLLSCPQCGSSSVTKALMAPAVRNADETGSEVTVLSEREKTLREAITALRRKVMETARPVGDDFAEVARQMHEGEVEKESIWGRATAEDARALAEDGVDFLPLPEAAEEQN
jgi:hypothetical protein